MLVPALIGVIALELIPAALTLGLAFTEYDALHPPVWVGLRNFAQLLADPNFGLALRNTAWFLACCVPLRLLIGLGSALLLSRETPAHGLLRAASLAPTLMPEAAYAVAWLWLVNPVYGPLNQLLTALGLPVSGWLADPAHAARVFVVMALFQAGESFLITLAALRSVPLAVREAAQLDGAGSIARLRWVTLPIVLPWLGVAALRDSVLLLFYTLAPTRLMSGGAPDYSTLFLPLYTFQQSVDFLRLGYGAAATLLLWLLALLPFGISVAWLRRNPYA